MKKSTRIIILLIVIAAIAGIVFINQGFRFRTVKDAATTSQQLPELVDLGGKHCIPCKKMAPILAELATEYAGRFKVTVIDVKENREAGRRYGIKLIPTQIFLDADGKEVYRHEGFLSKDSIIAQIKAMGVR